MPPLGCASVPDMTRSTRGRSPAAPPPFDADDPVGHQVWPVSTTWRSTPGKIDRAPQATQHSRPKGVRFKGLPRRNPRDPLSVTVVWRGGPEAWVELRARGGVIRVPGHTCIAELVLLLNNAQ